MDKYLKANRARWDQKIEVHLRSAYYDVAGFMAGATSLCPIERVEVGEVSGKTLLHLQCHIGLDTLSWARAGADATGLDFSPKAIAAARELSRETGLAARFVEGDLNQAPALIDGQFDIVFTSWGTIVWLPDIARWARVVAHFVAPGGLFYIVDEHPLAMIRVAAEDAHPVPQDDDFTTWGPLLSDGSISYTGDPIPSSPAGYEWIHSLPSIVSALADAGLNIEFLHEHDATGWRQFGDMVRREDGMWHLQEGNATLPLSFSIKATKPTYKPVDAAAAIPGTGGS